MKFIKEPLNQFIRLETSSSIILFVATIAAFGLANAGVILIINNTTNKPLAINIAISMVVGNSIGIFSFSWFSIKLNLAELPKNVSYLQLAGVSCLSSLGFTTSLYINDLAFTDPALLKSAKMGILLGSLIAGTLSFIILRFSIKDK